MRISDWSSDVCSSDLRKDAAALWHIADAAPAAAMGRLGGDLLALKNHMAGGRPDIAHQRLQQGRLAHAVMAEHTHRLARPDDKIQPMQDRDGAVARRKAAQTGRAHV